MIRTEPDGSTVYIPEDPDNAFYRAELVERVAEIHPEGIDGDAFFEALSLAHEAARTEALEAEAARTEALEAEAAARAEARTSAERKLAKLGLTPAEIDALAGR